jgi:hypothetical protein
MQHFCSKLIIMQNKFSSLFIATLIVLSACKKDPVAPVVQPQPQPVVEMVYTNLNNREVKYQQGGVSLDVNKDGRADLYFGVLLVGDPIYTVDKRQYIIASSITTALAVNINEQIIPLNEKELIPLNDFNGNNWYVVSEIILIERNEFANGTVDWRGNWLDREKKYLPFQFLQNNKRYNGWVELTADKTGERLVLHRMAISKEAEKEVKAGE